jgi:hypothetical protein
MGGNNEKIIEEPKGVEEEEELFSEYPGGSVETAGVEEDKSEKTPEELAADEAAVEDKEEQPPVDKKVEEPPVDDKDKKVEKKEPEKAPVPSDKKELDNEPSELAQLKSKLEQSEVNQKSTRNFATQVQQKNVALEQRVAAQDTKITKMRDVLKRENIEIEDIDTEPDKTKPVVAEASKVFLTSLDAADEHFGSAFVDDIVKQGGKFHQLLQSNPETKQTILQAIQSAKSPVFEMIKQVKEGKITKPAPALTEEERTANIVTKVIEKLKETPSNGGEKKEETGGPGGEKLPGEKLPSALDDIRSSVEKQVQKKTPAEEQGSAFSELPGGAS